MLSFRSLTTKFLVIYLPLTCLSVLVLFAVLEFRTYRAQNDELVSNLNKIISSDSILYSKLLWDFDTKNIETMLLNLLQRAPLSTISLGTSSPRSAPSRSCRRRRNSGLHGR